MILQIDPGINIGLQYIRNTSEYIPKLQLHQHFEVRNISNQEVSLVSVRDYVQNTMNLAAVAPVKSMTVIASTHLVR